ncbi:MAG: 4Fe-4S binding protein [Thermoplasmata archaeon]|nr:4Fe-4S binding protein [Thermoplasmata archaeon]
MNIQVDPGLCVLCGLCTGVCPPNALDLTPERLLVLPHCSGCGLCVPYCPVGALSGGKAGAKAPRRFVEHASG